MPPVITPEINEIPTMNPIGNGAVFPRPRLIECLLLRFCDPKHNATRRIKELVKVVNKTLNLSIFFEVNLLLLLNKIQNK